jgi:uncharacterized membrane protein
MKTYHLAGTAIVLAFTGIAAMFGAGYIAGFFGLTATLFTEVTLLILVVVGIALGFAAVAVEGRERLGSRAVADLSRLRRATAAKVGAHHVAWFALGLVLVTFVALGAGTYEGVYDGAGYQGSTVVALLVWMLLFVVLIIVFAAMVADRRLRRRHGE